MSKLLSLLVLSNVTLPSFNHWVSFHGKEYNSQSEYDYRTYVFYTNVKKIQKHNSIAALTGGWTMSVNKFADLTASEFTRFYTSYYNFTQNNLTAPLLYKANLPSSVDWTTKGAVTPVKDQGQCGSCWAFSATGALEGAWALKYKNLFNLSEQQLVDCSVPEGNQGCDGGLMDQAFQYVIDNKGLSTDELYPYSATGPNTCNETVTSVVKVKSFKDVPTNSETALMAAVAQQPVAVAVEADQSSFQFYSGGVMTKTCGTALDHGVLLVGYGTDAQGQDYYKVKNSWGSSWGRDGYILLGRGSAFGAEGQCGIQMDPSFPVV
jgi:C1A family cysteine protease